MRHPFLAIGISKNKVIALQFSSIRYDKKYNLGSHFSKDKEIRYKEIPVQTIFGIINQPRAFSNIVTIDEDLEYQSQANIDKLDIFDFNHQYFHQFELITECNDKKWQEIIEKLQTNTWENELMNEMVYQW
ncbi:MAG: hypothetical protein ACRC8P_00275 [Spiroplasma sp.]